MPLFTDYNIVKTDFVTIGLDESVKKIMEIDHPTPIVLRDNNARYYVFESDELKELIDSRHISLKVMKKIKINQILNFSANEISSVFNESGETISLPYSKDPLIPPTMRAVILNNRNDVCAIGLENYSGYFDSNSDLIPFPEDRSRYDMMTGDNTIRWMHMGKEEMPEQSEDEGTDIRRYPSITSDHPIIPGNEVIITSDLCRTLDQSTDLIHDVRLRNLPDNWSTIDIETELFSDDIEFENAKGTIVIHRNQNSEPAQMKGTIATGLPNGKTVTIVAIYSYNGRTCALASKKLIVGTLSRSIDEEPIAVDAVAFEIGAKVPKLTVRIFNTDIDSPGKLFWSIQIDTPGEVPGFPEKMSDMIDIGSNAKKEFITLFRGLAQEVPGQHMDSFNTVGEKIWDKTPVFFQTAYWALTKKFGSNFPIQFITNDPLTPWELMRPYIEGAATQPQILALTHPVARWVSDFEGALSCAIPKGKTVTIAPAYKRAEDELPYAQDEAAMLEKKYNATRIHPAYRETVMELLKCNHDIGPVSILHFAGHGKFNADLADQSAIDLTDSSLTANAVGNQGIKLGERYGTLVFFNACEVGLTGNFMGSTGGWALAFIRRKFKGFVAPLFKVNDENAASVTEEFFELVLVKHTPISKAILEVRKKFGETSPTYLSYLYYGDVMAELQD